MVKKEILSGLSKSRSHLMRFYNPVNKKFVKILTRINGFTLTELVVVITMLSILFGIFILMLNPVNQINKAKDTQRQNDIKQTVQGLDTFYNDKNCYPAGLDFGSSFKPYLNNLPQDPDSVSRGSGYVYVTDTSKNCPQWNVLFAKLAIAPLSANTSCILQEMPDCLPRNWITSGYNYCIVSGQIDCSVTGSYNFGNAPPGSTPTITPIPTFGPSPTFGPTPTSAPTPSPTPSGPWSVPFLGGTPSDPIHLTDCNNVTISGKKFVNTPDDAIIIENCNNVTVTGNDFSNDVGGIYAIDSTNITVTWNRYQNIGDGTSGDGHSDFVQFNNTFGGYIGHNKGKGGNTEEIISIYKSGGTSAANPLIVEYNNFQGTNWTSGSSGGIMLGDAGGHDQIARFNSLLSPGQIGIGVASGTNIHVTDNTVYGEKRTTSNVGMYVWNQYPTPCSGIEVSRNQVKWFKEDGDQNAYWNPGNCGHVSGEDTNNWDASLDPNALKVTL